MLQQYTMWAKESTLRAVIACFLCLLIACKKEGEKDVFVPADELTAAQKVLIPDKQTKKVSAVLSFKNLSAIDYISVTKSGGNSYSAKISGGELASSYTFNYTIQATDPQSFKLLLKAHYKDGNISNALALDVDNRWGFFVRSMQRVSRVTGKPIGSESFPNPNNTASKWNVGGTDLGIVWEMEPNKYGIFFGDTFGQDFAPNAANPGPNGSSWRSNVLAFSNDSQLDDGLTFSSMAIDNAGNAREIVPGGKDQSGNGNLTSIPSAAIRANGADYVHYFNIRNWTGWITNHSGLYKSVDNGETWKKCETVLFSANSNFGMAGYFKKDGYVYMMGTHAGRNNPAYLARFKEADIENPTLYEYWNSAGNQWITGNESAASILINEKVGELSFVYNTKHKKWILTYFSEDRYNITMRTAENITGPWSNPYELAAGTAYPQLYGSYLHPMSATGDNLYFLMSMWMPYNVFLMKAELADMGDF
ncbi:DUF4185 domain-containing protein [Niabella sp. 22666]|uniref:DUF4185 domain-containing protein n=1 Tax=Niabella sp. 22666 TaxID=3453954 RepID=UPI003F826B4A